MNKFMLFFVGCAMTLASCDDWLDVKPKTNVEEEELFKNEQGFKEEIGRAHV